MGKLKAALLASEVVGHCDKLVPHGRTASTASTASTAALCLQDMCVALPSPLPVRPASRPGRAGTKFAVRIRNRSGEWRGVASSVANFVRRVASIGESERTGMWARKRERGGLIEEKRKLDVSIQLITHFAPNRLAPSTWCFLGRQGMHWYWKGWEKGDREKEDSGVGEGGGGRKHRSGVATHSSEYHTPGHLIYEQRAVRE